MVQKKRKPSIPKKATPKHDKEYIGESKNKEYAKQKIGKKVVVLSIDKKSGVTKELSYKQYQSNKKRWNVGESNRVLMEAKEATNGVLGKRVWYKKDDSSTYEYKKFMKTTADGKKKVYFLELETNSKEANKPTRIMTFKQFKTLASKLQKNKNIKELMMRGYTQQEAEAKYTENKNNLYETRIKHIQAHKGYSRTEAQQYYKKIVAKGDFSRLKAYNYDGWKRLDYMDKIKTV
jgi:hypothetical protein